MSKLVLIRHGQSLWNLENRFTGWVDVPLTEAGYVEARKAARFTRCGVTPDGSKIGVTWHWIAR